MDSARRGHGDAFGLGLLHDGMGQRVVAALLQRGGLRQHLADLYVQACLDRHQSITLAGDTQQHVMKDAGFTSWADFFGHLGVSGPGRAPLRRRRGAAGQVAADLEGADRPDPSLPPTTP